MPDLSEADLMALARAAGITIPAHLIAEVGYSLNGLLEALENIEAPGVDAVEPLPIVIPPSNATER
jgi:hypothetical protein